MQRRWTFLIAFTVALLLAMAVSFACNGGGNGAVTFATDGDYHPFNFVNDDGELDGMERELGDELCRRAELECEWLISDWDTLIPDLVDEKFDVILAGMSITAERDETIDFTQPYYPPTPSVWLARAGAGDAAVDGTVGSFDNTIHSDYLNAQGIPYVGFDSADAQINALLNGEIDATLVDHGFAVQKMEETAGQVEVVGPSVALDMGLGMGVRETDGDLKAKLEDALASMKTDGSLNALIRKWVGDDASTF